MVFYTTAGIGERFSRHGKLMQASLTWLDLTAQDREKMRQVLDLFRESDTIDDMGLGTIRDTFANTLFPGTSTVQTRLRYFLFVPWLHQKLERERIPGSQVEEAAREAEIALIDVLANSEDTEGIIGIRARQMLGSRLPSAIYWPGVVRWGIFQRGQNRSWYYAHFDNLLNEQGPAASSDGAEELWNDAPTWHPRLPKPPKSFPRKASLALRYEEAEFLKGRIEERCAGSLLAWLVREGAGEPAESLWEDPTAARATGTVGATWELARRFSLHVQGLPLLYNLLLAELRHAKYGNDGDAKRIEEYRSELQEWAAQEDAEAPFDSGRVWEFLVQNGAHIIETQRRFVDAWARRLSEKGAARVAEDQPLRQLVQQREEWLKGRRARLVNEERLLDWGGRAGVYRMGYRWSRIRRFLMDLHLGLQA